MVASTSGETIDNKRRVDVIKQQEELIKEEEREKMEKNETKVSLLSFFLSFSIIKLYTYTNTMRFSSCPPPYIPHELCMNQAPYQSPL